MRISKTIFTTALITVLVLGSFTTSFGSIYDGGDPTTQENINLTCAYTLHDMGILQGTDTGFELNKQTTRLMGIVMLVRLLGQETAILNSWGESTTFTDVPNWGRRYTEFAEQHGLSKGIGNGKFGANNIMSAKDYATFLLRSLGYDDNKGDFSYLDSLDFFMEIGAISQEELDYLSTTEFRRGEMALMSYRALSTNLKGETVPLVEKLGKGWVVRADHTGIRDGSQVGYHIHFTDFGSLKDIVKTYDGWQPYGYPLESCFLYRCVSREYTNSNYFTLEELEHKNFSINSDDSTVGRGVHGIALCDSSGKELAYMRLFASMDNLEITNRKFIATPFPEKFEDPVLITYGLDYDKTSGTISKDHDKIVAQTGPYFTIYFACVNLSPEDYNNFTPDMSLYVMNEKNSLIAYDGARVTIWIDTSKYYYLLLFMDPYDNSPAGYKLFEK